MNVRDTVRPSLICTVWLCVSRIKPAGARVSVTTTLLPGVRPVIRIYSDR